MHARHDNGLGQESSQQTPAVAEIDDVIALIAAQARTYLASIDQRPVRSKNAERAASHFDARTPEFGIGALAALRELTERGMDATVSDAGPRNFHFVLGGTTPAALGGDWLASALDQIGSAWITSPLSVKLELVSLAWLRDFFGLPDDFVGIMTTGACMANFVGLAAARQWWAETHGVDVSESGLSGLPVVPVFSSGYVHASSIKVLAMLGIGRTSLRTFTRDGVGRIDLNAMQSALRQLDGAPAIIIANAGEVNAGDFDPIKNLAELATEYGSWLHVDGAFGLFAALSPRTSHLLDGLERADSVTVDGHK